MFLDDDAAEIARDLMLPEAVKIIRQRHVWPPSIMQCTDRKFSMVFPIIRHSKGFEEVTVDHAHQIIESASGIQQNSATFLPML